MQKLLIIMYEFDNVLRDIFVVSIDKKGGMNCGRYLVIIHGIF
jgi:hypothetical protein